MTATAYPATRPSALMWTGRVLSTIVSLFMTLDAVMHLVVPAPVVQAFAALGLPIHLSVTIGVLALVCTALYVIPRTSVLGAVLLTGYLGGAVAVQTRAAMPVFETLFPAIVGILLWSGLLLRDPALRSIFPLRS